MLSVCPSLCERGLHSSRPHPNPVCLTTGLSGVRGSAAGRETPAGLGPRHLLGTLGRVCGAQGRQDE